MSRFPVRLESSEQSRSGGREGQEGGGGEEQSLGQGWGTVSQELVWE